MPFSSSEKLTKIRAVKTPLKDSLAHCSICPRKCGADRAKGKRGYCRAPFNPVVYSYAPHHGEEPALSGTRGSGTIFFTHCNMKCAYCQNYPFSQLDAGEEVSTEKLSQMMLSLQRLGCHNINLVSPTHFVPQIVLALETAITNGLTLPIVYNTGGYDLPETIRSLEGIVDIYMPDMRYSDDKMATRYSDAPDYVEYNHASVVEMQRQVGDLEIDENGIARQGLIIRLLVMPEGVSGMNQTLRFIKDMVSANAYLSIMSQYYPTFKAYSHKEISRGITQNEYQNVVDEAGKLGLNKGWVQEEPESRFWGTNIQPRSE